MIKQNDTFLLPIWKLLLPFNVQIFSQNQIQYRVISNGKEKRANSAFITLFNEELPASKYEVEFDASLLSGSVSPKANTPLSYISINFRQVHSMKQKK